MRNFDLRRNVVYGALDSYEVIVDCNDRLLPRYSFRREHDAESLAKFIRDAFGNSVNTLTKYRSGRKQFSSITEQGVVYFNNYSSGARIRVLSDLASSH